jgi:predicted nuclease of predicted toxin-antitoxin system
VNIRLDENIFQSWVQPLRRLGHDIDTVREEGLTGQTDPAVWTATQRASRFFVTQDLDRSDVRVYTPGTHAGLLLVRLSDPGRNALVRRTNQIFETENAGAFSLIETTTFPVRNIARSGRSKVLNVPDR